MGYSGGHSGYTIRRRPERYIRTLQQQKFIDASAFCGIKKGITKSELMDKMKKCIPQYFKEHNDNQNIHI